MIYKILAGACMLSVTVAACGQEERSLPAAAGVDVNAIQQLEEKFVTVADTASNLDSPAVWHRADGTVWLIATGKQSDALHVFDGDTGKELRKVGSTGNAPGDFRRPNGIAIIDSLVFVVERDNRRVQVMSLPSFTPIGTFGTNELRKPYGLAIVPQQQAGQYDIYITDDFDLPSEGQERMQALRERVKLYRVNVANNAVSASLTRMIGDTTDTGRLLVVESIFADPANDRLLIAEEDESINDVKVYTLAGEFTGQTVGKGIFRYQAEGIALARCGGGGYWVMTDQDTNDNRFYVFDRVTFKYLGGFTGAQTANTDGIVLTQLPVGADSAGMFYALHDDGAVSAMRWNDIATALSLPACNP